MGQLCEPLVARPYLDAVDKLVDITEKKNQLYSNDGFISVSSFSLFVFKLNVVFIEALKDF